MFASERKANSTKVYSTQFRFNCILQIPKDRSCYQK